MSFREMALDEGDSTAGWRIKGVAALREVLTAQEGRMMLWVPVLLIAGIWTYFNLRHEPSFYAVVGLSLGATLLLAAGRRFSICLIMGLLISGFVLAKFRATLIATPLLRATVVDSDISGFVADADNRGGKRRILTIELDYATNIPEGETPRRVRITTYHAPDILIGDYIRMTARLTPLPQPVAPGGFDYGRDLYFQSVGAMGTSTSEPTLEVKPVPLKFASRRFFHYLRSEMGARITAVIPGPLGAFANAVITGERAAIPKEMNTSLQISGLAHILSISGLHMTLVAGGVFWVVRAFLALFPFLALNYQIKNWAAVAALIVGLIYMLLADSGSATERSYIMIAVMFFAMLVDRPAVSLRNLAISAVLILVVTPEESMGASFQMSFLAVMGLAAFFEWWNRRDYDVRHISDSRLWRYTRQSTKVVTGSILTTLVAGGFSSLAAAYHFGRMAPYGTVANGLSLPVVSFVVMPAALTSALVMPFGLEYYPLKLMESGLSATMWISDLVASWPGANVIITKPGLAGIVIAVSGAVFICIVAGRIRFVGLALLVAGFFVSKSVQHPQILIEERASNVAIVDDQQRLVFADSRKGKFAADKWLQSNGEISKLGDTFDRAGWTCVEGMCFADVSDKSIAYEHEQSDPNWTCPPVDILIADFPLRKACGDIAVRIDRFDLWKHGAHALYVQDGKVRIETVKSAQGDRPWVYRPRARPKPKPAEPELPPTAFSG
jgi:competence protein ComEC